MNSSDYYKANLRVIEITSDKDNKVEQFLQGQLSCNVASIEKKHAQIGAYCNSRGRTLCVLHVVKESHRQFKLLVNDELVEKICSHLQKYGKFSRIHSTISPSSVFAVFNKQLNDLINFHGVGVIIGGAEEISEGSNLPNNSSKWHDLLYKNKVPLLNNNTTEKFTPHDLSLPEIGAVSFHKGCYVGQEVIARMEHLGTPKRELYQLTALSEGNEILAGDTVQADGSDVGVVINAFRHENTYHCLAVLRKSVAREPLTIQGSDVTIIV